MDFRLHFSLSHSNITSWCQVKGEFRGTWEIMYENV